MRITIVQGAFFPVPPLRGGAVEKVWFALGKEFARRGHAVTHISRAVAELPQRDCIDGVEHVRVAGFDAPRSLLWLKFLDLIYSLRARRVLPPADVLVTNTFWLPLLVRDRSRGLLYVHVARYPKGQMRFYKRVARLQPVSRVIGDAITKEAPALASKVRVIPNALPFSIPVDVPHARDQTLLYVGRIHPEKGLDLLLEAAAKLPRGLASGWTLEMIGPTEERFGGGGEAFGERLRRIAERSVLKIEWVGAIFDQSELIRRYEAAALFVYPSTAETGEALPLAPLEAMANGCVPIVSRLACFDDYVDDGVSGFVFDHRGSDAADNLAGTITRVLQMRRQLDKFSAGARDRVKHFAVEPVADQYLADFETLLQEHHG